MNVEPTFILTESERRAAEEAVERERLSGSVPRFRFPDWVRMYRGHSAMSRPMLASGLFTFNRGPRAKYSSSKPLVLASYGDGATISYVGEELRQDDKRLLVFIIAMFRDRPMEATVAFNARDFVKTVGWSRESRSVSKLDESLSRMHLSRIELRHVGGFEWIHLIGDVKGRGKDRLVCLSPSCAALFDAGATYLPLETYRGLTDGATTWLQGFLAAFRAERCFELKQLHALSSCRTDLREFGELMRDVMPRLKEAKLVSDYRFSRGKLFVEYRMDERRTESARSQVDDE